MRFAIYITLLIGALPFVLTRPFFGLCVYYIVSFLDPKVLCWRPEIQDSFIVGLPLVVGAIVFGVRRNRAKPVIAAENRIKEIDWTRERAPFFQLAWPLCILVLLVGYIAITRFFVPYPLENSSTQFRSLCKVALVVVLLTGLASDQRRFRILYLVVSLSVGFWAIKGGLKFIFLGSHQLYGKTFDNNLFALTSVMVLPMIFYFGQSLRQPRWRWAFFAASVMICIAIVGAHSRAGFLAMVVVLCGIGWGSRFRFRAVLAFAFLGIAMLLFSGQDMRQRITGILNYEQDRSSLSRFFTWQVARDLFVEHPLIGVGMANYELAKQERMGDRKAAHNIYLQNVAELGILGHSLWLLMLFGTMLSLYLFMRRARRLPPELRWAYNWSRGLLLGLMGFAVHGFFHNEDFLELMLTMVGMNIALQAALRRELAHRKLQRLIAEPAKIPPKVAPASGSLHPGRLFAKGRLQGA